MHFKDHHSKSGMIGVHPATTTNSSMRIAVSNDYHVGKTNNYQKVSHNSIMQKRNSGHGGTHSLHENQQSAGKFLLNHGEESGGLPKIGPESVSGGLSF